MNDDITTHTRRYFETSDAWRDLVGDQTKTFSDAVHRILDGCREQKEDILDTSLGYLSEISHEISIYEDAIRRLQSGEEEKDIEAWLNNIGYPVAFQSTFWQTLGKKVAQLTRTAMKVIRKFVASCASVLGMPVSGIDIKFGIPHSLTVKFAP